MVEAKIANFKFDHYLINKSSIEITKPLIEGNINFGFNPRCTINKIDRKFDLELGTQIFDDNHTFKIIVDTLGTFSYEDIDNETILENFFYINAPAILFPYIRAYIASISSLSGTTTILLPTLNLTSLTEELKKNTKIIE